jgi:hypothetical protein
VAFLDYILESDIRFYQERDLGLDLYHSGFFGLAPACLLVSSATIFLLAIFHLLPRRKHTLVLLLSLGGIALALGFTGSYLHFERLAEIGASLIRQAAGPLPVTKGQEAAVVALPLLVGGATLAMNLLGCAYLALFWGAGLIDGKKSGGSRRASGAA